MGGKQKRDSASKQAEMLEFQSMSKKVAGPVKPSGNVNEPKNNIIFKGGTKIKVSDLKVNLDNDDIHGVVVSPEYLSFLEEEKQKNIRSEHRDHTFTEICLAHLLSEGFSIQSSRADHKDFMAYVTNDIASYSTHVSECRDFFNKLLGGRND